MVARASGISVVSICCGESGTSIATRLLWRLEARGFIDSRIDCGTFPSLLPRDNGLPANGHRAGLGPSVPVAIVPQAVQDLEPIPKPRPLAVGPLRDARFGIGS